MANCENAQDAENYKHLIRELEGSNQIESLENLIFKLEDICKDYIPKSTCAEFTFMLYNNPSVAFNISYFAEIF